MNHSTHLLCAGQGCPAVSLAHVSPALLRQRQQAATHRAQRHAAQDFGPTEQPQAAALLGRHILWHEEFSLGLYLLVCDTPLFRLTVTLAQTLPEMNDGQPLDDYDFGYVADVLRDLLADSRTVSEELHLGRALAWVEWEGDKLGD